MKRFVILITTFLAIFASSFSRDTIYYYSLERVLTDVFEISRESFEYKKFNKLAWPSHSYLISSTDRIISHYEDVRTFHYLPYPEIRRKKLRRYPPSLMIPLGVSMSKFSGDYKNTKYKYGFTIGVGAEIPMDTLGKIIADINVLYEPKGSAFEDSTLINSEYEDFEFYNAKQFNDYISLVLSFKRYFGKRQILYAKAGLYGSYLIKATFAADSYNSSENESRIFNTDNKNSFTSIDVGGNVCLGINTPVSQLDHSVYFFLETRFSRSFYSILGTDYMKGNIFNTSFSFIGGIRFPFN